MGGIGRDYGDSLNFDVIFSDDAGGRSFSGERAGGAGCALDVEERDALSVGRESRRVDVAMEFGEASGWFAVEMRDEEIGLSGLVGGIRTIGEEGDGVGVGRPDEIEGRAGLAGHSGGDRLALDEIAKRGDANLAGLEPRDALAIGRDCDLSDGAGAVLAGEDLVELGRWRSDCGLRGGGGLCAIEGSGAERQKKRGKPEASM